MKNYTKTIFTLTLMNSIIVDNEKIMSKIIDDKTLVKNKKLEKLSRSKTKSRIPKDKGFKACKVCNKMILHRGQSLSNHVKKHAKCFECKEYFLTKSDLNEHYIFTKHFSIAVNCQDCKKVFTINQEYKNHYQKCFNDNNFKCCIRGCHYIYKSSTALNNHLEQKHACNICKEYVYNVNQHVEEKHSTIVPHASSMSVSNWMTVKCSIHKNQTTPIEILRSCPDCRIICYK